MFKIIPALILILFCNEGYSQNPIDWGAFPLRIDAKPYAGKKFKLEAAVKVKRIDSTAEGELWVRVDKLDNKTGFFYNMMDKPIRLNEWKLYSISGRIDNDAAYLTFGGLYHRKGIFYFDDFKMFIESKKNKWEQIELPGGSFESAAEINNLGNIQQRNGFIQGVSNEDAFHGSNSFKVDGSNIVAPKIFGDNADVGKYVNVNGINIYYETYGSGPPLILLHGNSSPINSFNKQIPELLKYFTVIALDTRGQGKSTEDGKKYSYDLFAEDVNAVLDHLALDSVNILGWSDGGNTGLIMAMRFPKKVRRLVTMGALVFIDNSVVDDSVFKEVRSQLKEFKKDTSYDSKNNWRLANLLITEPNHTFNELKVINCPVLVMAGEKDLIKENHTKSIAANISRSTLYIAPKETHYFPQENPAVFNKIVKDFLLAK